MSSVSSSFRQTVVGLAVVVVTIGVVGLGCLSLLFTKSLSMESPFKPSCAAVRSFVSGDSG